MTVTARLDLAIFDAPDIEQVPCLVGPGKTTVARAVAAELRLAHLSKDEPTEPPIAGGLHRAGGASATLIRPTLHQRSQ